MNGLKAFFCLLPKVSLFLVCFLLTSSLHYNKQGNSLLAVSMLRTMKLKQCHGQQFLKRLFDCKVHSSFVWWRISLLMILWCDWCARRTTWLECSTRGCLHSQSPSGFLVLGQWSKLAQMEDNIVWYWQRPLSGP